MYSNFLKIWERRSSIRSRPKPDFAIEENKLLFAKNKQLLFTNDQVNNLSQKDQDYILAQSLFRYLNIIIKLELDLVNNICNKIINNTTVVKYNSLHTSQPPLSPISTSWTAKYTTETNVSGVNRRKLSAKKHGGSEPYRASSRTGY